MFSWLFKDSGFKERMERHVEEACNNLIDNAHKVEVILVISGHKKVKEVWRIPLGAIKASIKDLKYYMKYMNPKAKKACKKILAYEHSLLDSDLQDKVWAMVSPEIHRLSKMEVSDESE